MFDTASCALPLFTLFLPILFFVMNRYICVTCFLALTLFISACRVESKNEETETQDSEMEKLYDPSLKPFYHGVASGDPLQDRVVIWTRVTPEKKSTVSVHWEIAESEDFTALVKEGTVTTSASRDYTVKVDVTGLKPGTQYYYRFTALEKTSPVGRTKTLPEGMVDSLRFAVVSCSNWDAGYFNAYTCIARKEIDAVLHLGDYIYEYAAGRYGNEGLDRKHLPPHEIVTLQDYRTRYAQYHLDEGLRKLRQQHPFITIWDDHEVANNTYAEGAQNHQPDQEGDFEARRNAARQAYYEWIPIREDEKHYRSFDFGSLAELIMLDERLEARSKQLDSITDPALNSEARTMLGPEQLQWFRDRLLNSKATWKIIGNQVIFSDLDRSLINPKRPRNLDSWDGYPVEKRKIASHIARNKIKNVVFVTGDTHSSWAFQATVDLGHYDKPSGKVIVGLEFGTPSISSPNRNERVPDEKVLEEENNLMKANSHLKFVNQRDHGYVLLTVYPEKVKAEWFFVEKLLEPDDREWRAKVFEAEKNSFILR